MISESNVTNKSSINILGYSTYLSPHPDGTAHAGSAIVDRKGLNYNLLAPYDKDYLQAASVMVNTRTGFITLSAVYCPPKHKISEANFTDFFKTLGNRFIAGGDWNAKHIYWGSRLTTSRGRSLKVCLDSNHLLTLFNATLRLSYLRL
ncbi:unnamed protein product [Euphydryas editha]|uniref:Endonuclease/exonuclease/phosphatase domain-containing protein n=1 Tax=Euphydryas editha TaxID=104508 RepID=A0AAU9U5P6_EUPED|nr:unnamed protein product [Euphydryas editha]